ncbi:hypothetical protein H6F73_15900 [Microcoleus sp. FACHB-68]|nr:hypothetical protein [Microcoleus sp. FACHB-68]
MKLKAVDWGFAGGPKAMTNLSHKVDFLQSQTAKNLMKYRFLRECIYLFAGFVGISLDFYKAYMILTASHKPSRPNGH